MEDIQRNKVPDHRSRDLWRYAFISIFIGLIPGILIFIFSYYPRNDYSSVIFSLGMASFFSLVSFFVSFGTLLIIFNPLKLLTVNSTKPPSPSAWDYWQSRGLVDPDPNSMDAKICTPQPLSNDLYYDYLKINKHGDDDL